VTLDTSAFALSDSVAAKRDSALTDADERQFRAIAASLEQTVTRLQHRLDAALAAPSGHGQQAVERDLEVQRLTARLRTLRRFGIDLCLGRMVPADGGDIVYVGRAGLTDDDGNRLLVDWRSPAAEPFFAATHAQPLGLRSRRRYRWTHGRISDYWDEAFTADELEHTAALDDQSAFVASLAGSRSGRMRDVLATIQSDQDAIIRAPSRGALVVDGGPGTGKTVVALHRTAYLLYSEPRLSTGSGGVLFVGPSEGYLAYVDDVLPSLGEESVQVCTLRDLVPEGASALAEANAAVAAVKASARLTHAVEALVRRFERPPARQTVVETPWADVLLEASDWAEAFAAGEPGSTHNEAREQVWERLVEIVADRLGGPASAVGRVLGQGELRAEFGRAWPLLDPAGLVASLWASPALLRSCASWLSDDELQALHREDPAAWTTADLPLIDAARALVGDPGEARRAREREAARSREKARYARVIDDLIAADGSDLKLMSMLRVDDLQNSLLDTGAAEPRVGAGLDGPFAHIVVDEAQELTDAEWLMLLRRCPSRSLTIVGDRAQARRGFSESWHERLRRVGLDRVEVAALSVNYRTPAEIMAVAEPEIRAALPNANVPTSIRQGAAVQFGTPGELDEVVAAWLAQNEGTACVIGDDSFVPRERVRSLTAELAKGLEFDLVVVVNPAELGRGIAGAVDRYVAMTRATQQLVILATV
jgi:DNA helicase IV